MPIYYVVSGTLDYINRNESESWLNAEYIPKEIMHLLIDNHITAIRSHTTIGEKFEPPLAKQSKLPKGLQYRRTDYLHTLGGLMGCRFSYRITTTLENAVKLTKSPGNDNSDFQNCRPFFQVETKEEIPKEYLSYLDTAPNQIIRNEKLPPTLLSSPWTINCTYLANYYNIDGDQYRKDTLDRKSIPYQNAEWEIPVVAATSILVVPLIIYLIYRAYKWHEQATAQSLINQAKCYLSGEGEIYINGAKDSDLPPNFNKIEFNKITPQFMTSINDNLTTSSPSYKNPLHQEKPKNASNTDSNSSNNDPNLKNQK